MVCRSAACLLWVLTTVWCALQVAAQDTTLLIAGPMLGYVEHREAALWLLVTDKVHEVTLRYYPKDQPQQAKQQRQRLSGEDPYQPVKFILPFLQMGTTYDYEIWLNNQIQRFPYPLQFQTKAIWEHRTDPPPFAFLMGSCMYINEPESDRPGKPYGRDVRILDSMAREGAQLMLWLGDNIYLREGDWTSRSGFVYRYMHTRKVRALQRLLAAQPNLYIWDDHDFGPNDANSSFVLKEIALEVFKEFTANPTYGESENPGTYTRYTFSDCEFFLLDGRFYRSAEDLDSLAADKHYLGPQQFQWLKNALLYSKASFKFIVSGTQVLDPYNRFESVRHYKREFDELIDFIVKYRIKGVVFLSGDRHYSDVIRWTPPGGYPLYDITSSALTSGSSQSAKSRPDQEHPYRVVPEGVTDQNYVKISISGPRKDRVATIECKTVDGRLAWRFQIRQTELDWK
ncbi:MAG: alkaline phosphatase family protein [Chitinophagales bacterium]|nr:alkaline phosphatase family protein [Chitinophagales bacterium]MDW8427942.1 alkaline phosphatase D family protein [Chitinophagales bacterium]